MTKYEVILYWSVEDEAFYRRSPRTARLMAQRVRKRLPT